MKKILQTAFFLLVCAIILFGCEKHIHEYSEQIVSEASCSESGRCTYTCACGDVREETIPSTGVHVWDNGTVSAEATCIADGIRTYTCTTCCSIREEPIPSPGGHTWSDAATVKEATCAEEGSSVQTCTVCGETKEEPIPLTSEHVWNDGEITLAPNCMEKGIYTYTCTLCSATQNDTLDVTDVHTWDNGSVVREPGCASEGEKIYTCTLCRATQTEKITATGLHTWDGGTVTAEANCAAYGSRAYTCIVCGAGKTESIPKTTEHIWGSSIVTEKATCSAEGMLWHCCVYCGEGRYEPIPKTDEHTWDKYVSTQPTDTTEGVITYACRYCDETYTEMVPKYNFRPESYGKPNYIRNSNNRDNYLEFEIIGDILKISGKIQFDDLEKLWLRCGDASYENEYSKIIYVGSGQAFSVELSLKHISQKTFVTVYTYQKHGDGMFWSYTWDDVAIIPAGSGYQFKHSLVIDHNIEVMKKWIDPADCAYDDISEEIRKLSDSIVGQETDDYKKLYLLNKWVAENIYYDYDYYYGRSKELHYQPDAVYQYRRTVCSGYANLLYELIHAQGIPCIGVGTFSAGVSTSGTFDESNYKTTKTNHAHVEAYLASEDRWVIMDPTWDSGNRYENGQFQKGDFSGKYFDMTLDFFSYSHKLLERPV